ncbi:MAG: LpxI family protein [Siculibacillus sp.]
MAEVDALGRRDLGQAVIAADGRVVAEEDRRGTDAMVAAFGATRPAAARAGVLIKCPKPTQDRRLDMPAIGPDTVRTAAAAGLRGIAVEAGGTLVADRAEVVRLADALGLFVWGVAPSPEASP